MWDYFSFFPVSLTKTRKDKWGDCGIFLVLRSGYLQAKQVNLPVMQRVPIKCMATGKNQYGMRETVSIGITVFCCIFWIVRCQEEQNTDFCVCVCVCVDVGGWVCTCMCQLLMSTCLCGHVWHVWLREWVAKKTEIELNWGRVCVCVCVCGRLGVCMDMCALCTMFIHVIIVGVSPAPLWFCAIWPRWTVGLSDKRPHAGTPVKTLSPKSAPL